MFRHQLPAHSPLSSSSLSRSSIEAILRSNSVRASLGRHLKSRFDSREAILTQRGTGALQLSFQMLDRTGGTAPEVLLPAYSCYDLATAAIGAGVKVRFYDVDPTTLAPDERSVRDGLQHGIGAVVVCNLYGFPVDWRTLRGWCREAGVLLIEDVAQGLGTSWRGEPGGTFGDLTVLSFGRGKGWTGGGGGALLIRESAGLGAPETLPKAALSDGLNSAWVSTAQWLLARPSLFGIPSALPGLGLGETDFKFPSPPRRISAFSAALAFHTKDLAQDEVPRRRAAAKRLADFLSPHGATGKLQRVQVPSNGEASYLRFPVLLTPSVTGDLKSPDARKLGIAAGYPRPLPELPQLAELRSESRREFPGAVHLANHLVTFPTHSLVTPSDFRRIEAFLSRLT